MIIEPTIAMTEGESSLWQCSWCGSLVCATRQTTKPTGPCPVCQWEKPGGAWWKQRLPVGPFKES